MRTAQLKKKKEDALRFCDSPGGDHSTLAARLCVQPLCVASLTVPTIVESTLPCPRLTKGAAPVSVDNGT